VWKVASVLKHHAEISTVDPFAATRALHKVIGFALGRPAVRLTDDLAGLHRRQRCSSFLHARFFISSKRLTFAARQEAVLTFTQSRVGPDW
jgi:hypothetical protein